MNYSNNGGLFITLEGIDGCGKSLMAQLLYNWLHAKGYDNVCLTYEPGGSALGNKIRTMLLKNTCKNITKETEILLFAADRAQHVADIIKPALDDGQIVICDRYIDSSLAYQCGGRAIPVNIAQILNNFSIKGYVPDVTFYLQLSLDEAMMRWGEDIDRIELEDREFHLRVKHIYDKLAEENPDRIVVIDASLPQIDVLAQIQSVMEDCLKKYGLEK
ncbi:MAG: dTMP kinase [Bacillota bacterium]|jgi:dTMP kinase